MMTAVAHAAGLATDRARAAQLFHALSDETRLAILELLHDGRKLPRQADSLN